MDAETSRRLRLATPPGAPVAFEVELWAGAARRLRIGCAGRWVEAEIDRADQTAYLDLFERLAGEFGTRAPLARRPPPSASAEPPLRPLLTEPLSPKILYGYGDPCVVRVGDGDWRLLVTSNDAPDAFPILRSADLETWKPDGFVFPAGRTPPWALTGEGRADFWAPELHRVGEAWWVCFTARTHDGSLAIGLARAAAPDGPFEADPEPLVRGDVIDSHILIDAEGGPWLVWKKDDNGVWPRRLAALLHRRPELTERLFTEAADRRTAGLALTLWPWVAGLAPMEQFFLLQPLIEAASEDLPAFAQRLADLEGAVEPGVLEEITRALRTRIYIQRLAADGRGLEGEPKVILQNDLPWEAHLIEGVWITQESGRYYLLYAGNDFSTARYGIGVAVADAPTGPYRKAEEVFLSSTASWWGPGHPSVAIGPDGRHHVFLHAFRPGEAGYKVFRALLAAPIRFEDGHIRLEAP